MSTTSGNITLQKPIGYQVIDGQPKMVAVSYILTSDSRLSFILGKYDEKAPAVIDPVLVYSAVFGGSRLEFPESIAVDSSGNTYVAGHTESIDFPMVNAIQGTSSGLALFVSKLNASGTALEYSTYLSGVDGFGIAVDKLGQAYVTGGSQGGLPLTHAAQPTLGGGSNAFVTVLGPSGDSLVYSTYLGGPGYDFGTTIALDEYGNAYITGTSADGFPTLHSLSSKGVIFAAKFDSSGGVRYSSVFATNAPGNETTAAAIAVDRLASAYITGSTYASSFPVTPGAFQSPALPAPMRGMRLSRNLASPGTLWCIPHSSAQRMATTQCHSRG